MSTLPFQRLVIDGVGLLGGSLGLGAQARGLARQVVGLGRSPERLERARQLGAIQGWHTAPEAALHGADALVLAVPPRRICERLEELAPWIAAGTFVTDVGSVKERIVATAERVLAPGVLFIGSHPMAGSEKSGVEFARADFYKGSACLLTPTAQTPPAAQALAGQLWEALGARLVVLAPERHDTLLAGISHLPHLAAAALMQALDRKLGRPEELAVIAGGGLRDTTRIAASDPELWKQIFAENAPALLEALEAYLAVLQEWRGVLACPVPDMERLGALFQEGHDARQEIRFPTRNSE